MIREREGGGGDILNDTSFTLGADGLVVRVNLRGPGHQGDEHVRNSDREFFGLGGCGDSRWNG